MRIKNEIFCKDTKETVNIKDYYKTQHWFNLQLEYMKSDLSKRCCKCKLNNIPAIFIHRTKKQIGNEKLTDISPLCSQCSNSNIKPSKKKTERQSLSRFGFNPDYLTADEKNWYLSIKSYLRGHIISKHFSNRAAQYKPSQQWINNQVNKACKWIKKCEKSIRYDLENTENFV